MFCSRKRRSLAIPNSSSLNRFRPRQWLAPLNLFERAEQLEFINADGTEAVRRNDFDL